MWSKKVHEGICLSSPGEDVGGSKVLYGWNITFIEIANKKIIILKKSPDYGTDM